MSISDFYRKHGTNLYKSRTGFSLMLHSMAFRQYEVVPQVVLYDKMNHIIEAFKEYKENILDTCKTNKDFNDERIDTDKSDCKKMIEELLESIDEYATATFESQSCGPDYYKCNMCEAEIRDSHGLKHLYGRSVLDKIEHYDDCPYILAKKVCRVCDE
jgi:hypothetical protein